MFERIAVRAIQAINFRPRLICCDAPCPVGWGEEKETQGRAVLSNCQGAAMAGTADSG